MALTVEPGLYIRPSARVPKEFWNIGARIEDDVLVTGGAPEVLTAALEKTSEAIERLVAS
jgi:Xaa-Pro aminopeptidase